MIAGSQPRLGMTAAAAREEGASAYGATLGAVLEGEGQGFQNFLETSGGWKGRLFSHNQKQLGRY